MSVQADRGRWVVRWRDEFGQQRQEPLLSSLT
jgi:hypothetical protein